MAGFDAGVFLRHGSDHGAPSMKHILMAAAFAVALGGLQYSAPAQAQGDVRTLCNNKYGLGKRWSTASEAERKDAATKIAACIRSGGKA